MCSSYINLQNVNNTLLSIITQIKELEYWHIGILEYWQYIWLSYVIFLSPKLVPWVNLKSLLSASGKTFSHQYKGVEVAIRVFISLL